MAGLRSRLKRWVPPALVDAIRGRSELPDVSYDLPGITLAELEPASADAVVHFPTSQIPRTRRMVLPLADLMTFAALSAGRRPKRIFEIGTFTGSTTLVLAMNTPADSELYTLDLDPKSMPPELLDADGRPLYDAGILFRGKPESAKIHQLYGFSDKFDYSPYWGSIDLVYIDAVHTYEAVLQDSQTAFRLLSPNGIVVWDDYRWLPEHADCAGVTKALHELAATYPIRQLEGTRLAVLDRRSTAP